MMMMMIDFMTEIIHWRYVYLVYC